MRDVLPLYDMTHEQTYSVALDDPYSSPLSLHIYIYMYIIYTDFGSRGA